jgi:acyl-CoA thioester hydrolase
MGVVHHGAYPLYMESARVEYLRAIGRPYHVIREQDQIEFPVAEMWIGYRRPLRFDDLVDVWINVGTARAATFEMGYLLCVGGEPCATAVTMHAAVTRDGRAVRNPGWLRELVAPEGEP